MEPTTAGPEEAEPDAQEDDYLSTQDLRLESRCIHGTLDQAMEELEPAIRTIEIAREGAMNTARLAASLMDARDQGKRAIMAEAEKLTQLDGEEIKGSAERLRSIADSL